MKKSSYTISTKVRRGDTVVTDCIVGTLTEGVQVEGYKVRVLWDTGATTSAISERLAAKLQLEYLRHHDVETAHGGKTSLPGYSNVSFMLFERTVITPQVTDVVSITEQDIDAIIGMDIISLGTLQLKPLKSDTRFTFSMKV